MKILEWEYGPDPNENKWENAIEAEYLEYKDTKCYCTEDLECPCLSYEDFRLRRLNDRLDYFDDDNQTA